MTFGKLVVALALVLVVAIWTGGIGTSGAHPVPVVGLPCEGCEAAFDGLPAVLSECSQIASLDESGDRLRITGTVTKPDGRPARGVVIYAYHTDAKGIYPSGASVSSEGARRHGRLRGWAQTDEFGHYQFETIRPGSYPDRKSPAHVHMHVVEGDCCTYYIDSIVFTDDPLLSSDDQKDRTAARGGSGVVRPRLDADGNWIATRNIRLGENVPGYPEIEIAAKFEAGESETGSTAGHALGESFLITEPEWSRDGQQIVFAGGEWPDLDIFVLDVRSGHSARLFHDPATDYMPSWSPDGKRVVFASTRAGTHDLYVGSVVDGSSVRVTHSDRSNETEPRWSPDGMWIAFRSDRDGNRDIYRMRPDGRDQERLTTSSDEDGEPSWSPDGQALVFTSSRDGQPEIYSMLVDGQDQVRLTTTPEGHARRAEWSPDGTSIAFGSNRDGNEDLYLMNADGSKARNLSRNPAREYYSRWSPDGGSLVFTSNQDRSGNALYTMKPDGTGASQIYPNRPSQTRDADSGAAHLCIEE